MDLLVKLSVNLIVAVLVIWLHEIPKHYLTIFLTRPAFRKDVKIKGKWKNCIDPIGLITFVFLQIGWQMPLKVDATKLTNKKNGLIAISVTGLLINLLMAVLAIMVRKHSVLFYSLSLQNVYIDYFISAFAFFNMVIFTVNLLPVPPLDMTKIVYAFSSDLYFKIIQNGRILQTVFVFFIALGWLRALAGTLYKSLLYLSW